MVEFIQFAMLIGFLLGLVHGVHLFRTLAPQSGLFGRARGLYFGVWALTLWTVLGPYVLAIWLIGGLFYLAHRLRWRRNEPSVGPRGEMP